MTATKSPVIEQRPSAEQIAELRSQGLGWRRVSMMTGVPITTLRRIADPGFAARLRKSSAEAKRRRHGVCERCGDQTNYNGGKGGRAVSRYCVPCGADVGRETALAARGTGSMNSRVLEILADGREHRHVDICSAIGIPNTHVGPLFVRLMRYGLIERTRRGYYRKATGS